MTKAYWIAHVKITDLDKYKNYMALAPEAFLQYDARFLARGTTATTLEGAEWDRHAVIEFDSVEQAQSCYSSMEYQKAKTKRDHGCVTSVTIVEGLSDLVG